MRAFRRFHGLPIDQGLPIVEPPDEGGDNSPTILELAQVDSSVLSCIMTVNRKSVCSSIKFTHHHFFPSIAATCRSSAACTSPGTCFFHFITATLAFIFMGN